MDRQEKFTIALLTIVAVMVGIGTNFPTAKSPKSKCFPCPNEPNAPKESPEEKVAKVQGLPDTSPGGKSSNVMRVAIANFSANPSGLQAAPAVSQQGLALQKAPQKASEQLDLSNKWDRALEKATLAVELGKDTNASAETLAKAQSLWQEAIELLHQIPKDADLGKKSAKKIEQYKGNLANIEYRLETAQSDFLQPIAQRSGLSSKVKITICHLHSGRCRRLRGNERPRSVASLMKVPVAVALMHKLTTDKIRFDTPIYVDRGNFTEDASHIRVGQTYSLERLLTEMIALSSNIATNQLIDYLGWNYINRILQERGFQNTRIQYKVVGDKIWPRNPGFRANTSTADELTDMMLAIYNREHLGDEILIRALERQYDRALGFAGLEGAQGKWLGEKTGQTSRVLGTTLAMNLFGETYVITVIDDGFYSEPSIRNFIEEIAEYIFRNGHI